MKKNIEEEKKKQDAIVTQGQMLMNKRVNALQKSLRHKMTIDENDVNNYD